jgi:hypothetical protein
VCVSLSFSLALPFPVTHNKQHTQHTHTLTEEQAKSKQFQTQLHQAKLHLIAEQERNKELAGSQQTNCKPSNAVLDAAIYAKFAAMGALHCSNLAVRDAEHALALEAALFATGKSDMGKTLEDDGAGEIQQQQEQIDNHKGQLQVTSLPSWCVRKGCVRLSHVLSVLFRAVSVHVGR